MSNNLPARELANMILSYAIKAPLFLTFENIPRECLDVQTKQLVEAFIVCAVHDEPINAVNLTQNIDGIKNGNVVIAIANELSKLELLNAQEHDAYDALKKLKEINKVAKLKDGLIKSLQECDAGFELEDLIANAEERLTLSSAEQINVNTQMSLHEAAEQSMQEFYNPVNNWVSTGYKVIDEDIGGVFPGEMVIISGISGSGKSQFALQVAQNITDPNFSNDSIFYFSMEMKPNNLFNRLMCSQFRWDIHLFRRGIIPSHVNIDEVKKYLDYLSKHRFYIEGASNLNLALLKSSYNRLKRKHGKPKAVFIDHILLMEHGMKDDFTGTAKLSRGLTAFSRDEELPLFALTQLTKDTLKRADGKPTVNDLKNSTQIFNDAAHIWFTHNPFHVDNTKPENKNIIQVLQRKSRYGDTGKDWTMGWYHGRFTNEIPRSYTDKIALKQEKQYLQHTSAYEYEDPADIFK